MSGGLTLFYLFCIPLCDLLNRTDGRADLLDRYMAWCWVRRWQPGRVLASTSSYRPICVPLNTVFSNAKRHDGPRKERRLSACRFNTLLRHWVERRGSMAYALC